MERRSSEVQSFQYISANQLFFPSQLQRDKSKQLYCKQQQITLVTVNPQWNGTWSQLRATIRNSRPGTTLKVCLLLTFFLEDLLTTPDSRRYNNIQDFEQLLMSFKVHHS